jgi:hypothetical protein
MEIFLAESGAGAGIERRNALPISNNFDAF